VRSITGRVFAIFPIYGDHTASEQFNDDSASPAVVTLLVNSDEQME
jgi:hypothetical protein